MTPTHTPAPPARRRRRRFVLILGLILLAGGGVFAGALAYRHFANDRLLRAAIAEVEATDPHWRLEALEAQRAAVPDAENAAHVIRQVEALFGRARPIDSRRRAERWHQLLTRLSPEVRLTDEQYRSVTDMVGAANAAVETTLSLARYPRGRHPISYHGIFAPSMDDFNVYEYVLGPLQLARTHEGDSVAALRVCRATLNVGRSFGDEPDLRLQKVRQYYHAQAIGGLMRLLGQCEATEADLAAFQPALAEEAESDTWALVLRGQRAAAFQALEAVRSGELKPWILRSVTPDPPRSDKPIDAVGEWLDDYFAPDTRPAAAWALRYCTRLLEAAELPWPQRRTAVEALAVERDDSAELAWEILWRVPQLAGFFQTAQAHGRCAVVAVAVERHRLRRGSWPDSLAALVPDLLPAVPIDPFNGQPLYYRRTANGVVIYSVGTNGADDGGKLFEVHALSSGADLGVRLWDVPHRRQSPAPPPPSEPGR